MNLFMYDTVRYCTILYRRYIYILEFSNGIQFNQKERNVHWKKCISKEKVLLVFGMKMTVFTSGKKVIIEHLLSLPWK